MKEIKRVSPVVLKSTPVKTKTTDNWEIVMEYEGEGDGPFLIDLTHKQRFDYQNSNLGGEKPFHININLNEIRYSTSTYLKKKSKLQMDVCK